jgi:hypothetical protein
VPTESSATFIDRLIWPTSSSERTSSRRVRSPSATAAMTSAASASGRVMLRVLRQATSVAMATARPSSMLISSMKLPAVSRAAAVSFWFIASSRSMNTLITRSHSTKAGLASSTSTVRACFSLPARRSSTTRSISGRVCSCTLLMSASAATSAVLTLDSSAKIWFILASESAYLSASFSMRSTSSSTWASSVASTTSRTAMARSCTLPRKLIA